MCNPLKNAGLAVIRQPRRPDAVHPAGRTAPAAGAARPPQAVANIRNVAPTNNGSVYFMPYKYYLSSSTMVFSAAHGWDDERFRYKEFLTAMRDSMSGDYNAQEAIVVCRIFEQDMRLMFYEKAIQEIQIHNDFNLIRDQSNEEYPILKIYRKKLTEQKAAFSVRKRFSPPSNFSKQALWFASVSNRPAPCLSSTGEHAGSIYFDGGRIRLMHNKGPIVEEGKPTRTLNGASLLEKPTDAEAFDSMINQTKQQNGIQAVTLVEYNYRGTHTSRGYPKTVNLLDEDIAQLYYLAKRITFMLEDNLYELMNAGVTKKAIINAGNKLMADFIRNRGRLKAELGY